MESNLLRVFLAVAKKKSITLGAKKLKVTQTNVTLRIKQFEKNLGYKLFHRVPKGIILTKEGELLLPMATEIIKKLDEAHKVMKNVKDQNSLIIASTFSNASMRLIPFLQKLHIDYPDLQLELITDNTIPITQLLLDYKVDIGFINHEPSNNELIVLNKFDNELLLIEPKKEIKENVYVDLYVNVEDPKNSVLIKDAMNKILITRLGSKLVKNKINAQTIINVKLNSVSMKELQYDEDGYTKLYRAVVSVNVKIINLNNVKSFNVSGNYDFSVDDEGSINETKRFEAIKNASAKALEQVLSKLAILSFGK